MLRNLNFSSRSRGSLTGANPDDLIQIDIPPNGEGYWWVIKGDHLSNSLVLRALGTVTNVLTAGGYIIRDTGSA